MSSVSRGGGSAPRAQLGGWSKRSLDLICASVALCTLSPVLLLAATLVRLSGKPVLVTQDFIGADGQLCRARRFRTLPPNSRRLLASSAVSPFAQWLRESGIADLPMLFNVLKGEMSLVGPSPRDEAELERLGPASTDLLRARPGLISPSKLAAHTGLSAAKRVSLDRDYVRQYTSVLDDLRLIARATVYSQPT